MSSTETPQTGMPDAAALDVKDLEVTFHRRGRRLPVLKGVTLKIERGEAYGLVGESGCGKTTLAMAAMRYLAANGTLDNGRVLVDGQDVSELSEEALRKWRGGKVAMVYQDPTQALSPAMKIGDQLAEVFHYHEGLDKKAALEKARESLRRVPSRPDSTLRRYPFELSGGQQQRVVIAMALAVNPQLLILDEPTTGLDATVEAEILDLIEELRGRSTPPSSSSRTTSGWSCASASASACCTPGGSSRRARPSEIFTDPRHPYTMGLLRCVPRLGMNKTDAALQTIPGTLPALGDPLEGCVYSARCPMAKDICRRREPDLFAWPSDEPGTRGGRPPRPCRRTRPPTRRTTRNPVGASDRHARCYFAAEAPSMPHMTPVLAKSLEERGVHEADVLDIDHVVRTFKHARKSLTAVADVSLTLPQGRDLWSGRRVGQWQDVARQCVTGLLAANSGTITFEGGVLKSTAGKRSQDALRAIQMVFQNPDSTLNPAWSTRQILTRAVTSSAGARRARYAPRSTSSPRTCASNRDSCSRGPRSSRAGRAACRDRARVCRRPPPCGLRRAGVGARRLGAGEHPQPARRAADQREDVVRVHQPRPRRGALYLGPHRRHVPGRAHRGRGGGGRVRPAAPSLHGGAAQLHPEARLRGAEGPHPAAREHAEPDRSAVGLPLPHALPPIPRGDLRAADAAGAGRRRRAHLQVPHPAGRAARAAGKGEAAPAPERRGRRRPRRPYAQAGSQGALNASMFQAS